MKKRIMAMVLTVVMLASLAMAITVPASAENGPQTNKSKSALTQLLTEFIVTSLGKNNSAHKDDHKYDQGQVARDDYWNMPEGMQTMHPLTAELMAKGEEAVAVRARGDVVEMDTFLVNLYGGWGKKVDKDGVEAEEESFLDENLPYTAFQNTLNIRWAGGNHKKGDETGLEAVLYFGIKPFNDLKREEYTIESWEYVRDALQVIEDYVPVTEEYPLSHLAVCTRSEMYYNIQNYYAGYDKLVKFTGNTEVNKYKGYLYDIIENQCEMHKTYPWSFEEIYSVMDVTKEEDCPQLTALKNFVAQCRNVLADTNATVEQVQACLNMNPLYTVRPAEGTKYEEGAAYSISAKDLEYKLLSGELSDENIDKHCDENDEPIPGDYIAFFEYKEKMNTFIQDFRNAIYVGNAYRDEKTAIYNKALLELASGKYGTSADEKIPAKNKDFVAFMKSFEQGDSIVNSYLTKESQLVAAIAAVREAYEVLQTKGSNDPQYVLTYNMVKDWVAVSANTAVYTDESVEKLKTVIATYEEAYNKYSAGDTTVTEKDLYDYVLQITSAKDSLVLIPVSDDTSSLGLDAVLNQMTMMLDEFTFIKDEFASMFEDVEISDSVSECWDMFCESYDVFEKLVNKGLDEVAAKEEDPKFEYTVTVDALFAAMLELYQVQNSLTLQVASPSTAND